MSGGHEGMAGFASGERIDSRQVAGAFGRVLRAVRREHGFSQEELAANVEVDRTYPSLLERGLRHPTLTMLLRLARALAIEPAELVNATVRQLRERDAL